VDVHSIPRDFDPIIEDEFSRFKRSGFGAASVDPERLYAADQAFLEILGMPWPDSKE